MLPVAILRTLTDSLPPPFSLDQHHLPPTLRYSLLPDSVIPPRIRDRTILIPLSRLQDRILKLPEHEVQDDAEGKTRGKAETNQGGKAEPEAYPKKNTAPESTGSVRIHNRPTDHRHNLRPHPRRLKKGLSPCLYRLNL